VLHHHYSGSYPVEIAAYGMMECAANRTAALVGVAVFSVPVQPRAAAAYGAQDAPFCDLGRFLLLDHVPGNAETWFLRRALAGLARDKTDAEGRPAYALCLAYSDPVPRVDRRGRFTFAGHYGGIYGASSALYLGRATPRTLWLADDASVISSRALSKLRQDDKGARYAYETLRRHGAPAIRPGEASAAYVERALREGPFRPVRHRGNHVYAFPGGSTSTRRRVRARVATTLPYPTRTDLPAA
jgi:hypothetical protein